MRTIIVSFFSVLILGNAAQAASDDFMNLRTSPLGLLIGVFNVRADFRIGDQLTLGPQISSINREINDIDVKAGQIGFNLVYHFDEVFADGWYFDGGIYGSRVKAEEKDAFGIVRTAEAGNSGIVGILGYHWFWETFNLNLGAGLQTNSAGEIEIKDAAGNVIESVNLSGVSLAADFSIGWTF